MAEVYLVKLNKSFMKENNIDSKKKFYVGFHSGSFDPNKSSYIHSSTSLKKYSVPTECVASYYKHIFTKRIIYKGEWEDAYEEESRLLEHIAEDNDWPKYHNLRRNEKNGNSNRAMPGANMKHGLRASSNGNRTNSEKQKEYKEFLNNEKEKSKMKNETVKTSLENYIDNAILNDRMEVVGKAVVYWDSLTTKSSTTSTDKTDAQIRKQKWYDNPEEIDESTSVGDVSKIMVNLKEAAIRLGVDPNDYSLKSRSSYTTSSVGTAFEKYPLYRLQQGTSIESRGILKTDFELLKKLVENNEVKLKVSR